MYSRQNQYPVDALVPTHFKLILRVLGLLTTIMLIHTNVAAELKPAAIFSDHMVLQRDMPIQIWGWAAPGDAVSISLGESNADATANDLGKWLVTLPDMPAGGPHTITLANEQGSLLIEDVLIGEVWVGSGQSNMEWQVAAAANSEAEIANGNHPNIRMFTVVKNAADEPADDVEGAWQVSSPETVGGFSAVGYYFARELQELLDIPVGIIHSSWGGTPAEAWTRLAVMRSQPELQSLLVEYENVMANVEGDLEAFNGHFSSPESTVDFSEVPNDSLAGDWDLLLEWQQLTFHIPLKLSSDLALNYSHFQTPVNAPVVRMGSRMIWTYQVPPQGRISMEVTLVGQIAFQGKMSTALGSIPIRAVRRSSDQRPPVLVGISPQNRPARLFNGMIQPLIPLAIRGVIWYQGEANANSSAVEQYHRLFMSMIEDWRVAWGDADFPFYFVQLANFRQRLSEPQVSSFWAELREAQLQTLALSGTAQAVIIDIGEADDIHPKNKQEVGRRLALPALANIYGKENTWSGPLFQSAEIVDDQIILQFDHTDGGLAVAQGEKLVGFAVAGADRKFVWGDARIEGDKVVVSATNVASPLAVRYAWADNPAANLINGAGLPASPFRTDDWLDPRQ